MHAVCTRCHNSIVSLRAVITSHVWFLVFPYFFVSVPCARLRWPYRQLFSACKYIVLYCIQWCSGAGTRRNVVPVNILEPERRSGNYSSSQTERYCCSVPANVCLGDQITVIVHVIYLLIRSLTLVSGNAYQLTSHVCIVYYCFYLCAIFVLDI